MVLILTSGVAFADDKFPVRDFTFKRVPVPSSGQSIFIDVQIDPAVDGYQPLPVPQDPGHDEYLEPVPKLPNDASSYAWFWRVISPRLSDASSVRLDRAVAALGEVPSGKAVPAPRLQDLHDITSRYGRDILLATIGTDISPAFALAVISVESGGRSGAVSGAGAQGLMQLIPATAERFGVKNGHDPAENIRGGVAYLDWLMDAFDGDPLLALAGYNAGENAVIRHEGVPPYDETRAYVPKVLAAWAVARGLCVTLPELVSDGCVFTSREARADE